MAENFVAPPSLQPQLPVADVARPWWKKPWVYAVLLLVVAVVAGGIFFWIRSRQPVVVAPALSPSPLPLSETGSSPTSTPIPDSLVVTLPSPVHSHEAEKEERLAIDILYNRSPEFTLAITSIVKTTEDPTIDLFAPPAGSPYSLLQLLDTNGTVMSEHRFTVTTQTNVEFFEDTPREPITHLLSESSNRFVVAVPHDRIPAKAVVRSANGALLSEQSFTFTSLPSFTPHPTSSPLSWLERVKSWFSPGQAARAQAGGDITLVVINEVGALAQLDTTVAAARQIMAAKPWSTFAANVRVVPVPNAISLRCGIYQGPSTAYPICRDSGQIISVVAQQVPTWDGIIVATNVDCNCGVVSQDLSPIVAVGSRVTYTLLLHELGHALGKMTDEYLYQWGTTQGIPGPNCYDGQAACQQTATKFPGAVCSLGCNSITSWRPSSRIMHNTYSPLEFGPVEECMMGKALANIAGGTYPCPDDDPGGDDGSGGRNDFYGWRR